MATEHRNGMAFIAGLASPGPTYVLPSNCFDKAGSSSSCSSRRSCMAAEGGGRESRRGRGEGRR